MLLAQGEIALAVSMYEEGLQIAFKLSFKKHVATLLTGLIRAFVAQGRLKKAACLMGTVEGLFEVERVLMPDLKADYQHALAQLVRYLSTEQLAALKEKGRTFSREQIFALLRGDSLAEISASSSRSPSPGNDELTPRQLEILRLVSQGLSDSEIAHRLSISPRTVNTHLTTIYQKIGVSSRSAATRYTLERGLS